MNLLIVGITAAFMILCLDIVSILVFIVESNLLEVRYLLWIIEVDLAIVKSLGLHLLLDDILCLGVYFFY